MDVLFNYLIAKDKGCIRFEYGREWLKFIPEEQLEYVDKGVSVRLDTHVSYLQKANQLIQNEQQIIKQ